MKLAYRAFDKSGREVTDVVEAPGPEEATETLRRQDLFVAEVTVAEEQVDQPAKPGLARLFTGAGWRMRHLVMRADHVPK